MKRNKLLTLLVLVALLSLAVLVTACEIPHAHAYTQKVATADYLASPATCVDAARYYYSCICGAKGEKTFSDGEPDAEQHAFTVFVEITTNPTVDDAGVATFKCANCDATDAAVVVPKLSDTSAWGATPNPAPTHTTDGKTDYTSPVYGTITVDVPKLSANHVFDQKVVSADHLASKATCTAAATYYYSCACGANGTETFSDGDPLAHAFTVFVAITTNPTVDDAGVATFKCPNCEATDTNVAVAKLSDSTVWTATPNPAATHLAEGTMEYTSASYPNEKFTSTIAKLAEHTFDQQVADSKYLVSDATYTSAKTYHVSCKCGEAGDGTFTVGDPLAAPYLGKTYTGDIVYWSGAQGKSYTFTVGQDGTAEDTFKKPNGTKTEEDWYNDTETTTTITNSKITFTILDNSGKVKVNFSYHQSVQESYGSPTTKDVSEDHIGFISSDGNYFIINSSSGIGDDAVISNSYYVFTAVETPAIKVLRFNSFKLAVVSSGETTYSIYIGANNNIVFGAVLADINGNVISVDDIDDADYFAIIVDGEKIAGYYRDGDELLPTDGIEGVYVNDGTSITLDGHGGIVITSDGTSEVGIYKRPTDEADYDIDVTTDNLYWQVTLDGNSFTKVAPIVTITFNANGGVPGSVTMQANVNVPCTLLTVTRSGFKFIGWYSDEGLTQLVQEPFVPTEDVTLYAKWSSAVTIVFQDLVDGATTSHKQYLDELVLANAPAYTETTKNGNKLFRGWYVGDFDDPTFIDADRAITDDDIDEGTITIKPYWVDVVTLTVVYGNGINDANIEYATGDELGLDALIPAYTNGKIFSKWGKDVDGVELFDATTITENTTVYAVWESSIVPFIGSYNSAVYFYLGSASYDPKNISFVNSSTTIAADGTVSGYISGTITSFNAATGEFVMDGKVGMYDAEHGVIVFVNGTTYQILFVDATASAYGSTSSNVRFWNYGKAVITRVALTGGKLDDIMLFIHNGKLYVNVHATYISSNKTVNVDDVASIPGLPDALTVYDVNNNVIATLKKNKYNLYDFDNLNGTYTGDRGEVVVDGFGGLTVGGAAATYAIVGNGVIGYTLNNEYVELTLGDGTYTSTLPVVDVKFNTGSVGTSGITFVESYNKNVEHTLPSLDVADGYIFIGWYNTADFDGDAVTSIVPTDVITLYAKVVKGVTLSYTTEHGTAPQRTTVLGGTVVELPELENITGWSFIGWYVSGDETQTIVTSVTADEDVVLVAKWQIALKLTLVYGNTLSDQEKWYSDADTFDVADFAPEQTLVNGKVFDGWCTDAACETAFTATSISDNTTIYAKWSDPHPMYGEYGYGANLDPTESGIVQERSKTLSTTSTSYIFSVDAFGGVTGGVTSTIKEFDSATGVFKTANNYWGGFNAAANVMYADYGANKTTAYHDIRFAVGAIGDVYPVSALDNAWDKGITKFVRITYSDNSVRYILIKDRVVYAVAADGWTATDANGNDVTFENVYSNAQTLTISGAQNDGTIVPFKLGKSNNNFVALDGREGTYTLDGGANLVLDGVGGASLVGETTVSGTYTAIDGGIELYMNNKTEYYTAVLNVEAKTYTITKPVVTISFVTEHGTAPTDVDANVNIKYTLPAAPAIDGDAFTFRGWYLQGDESQTLVKNVTPAANETYVYVAKWDAKVTVTVNYNKASLGTDGTATQTFYVGDKMNIALPTDIIDNQYASAWFTSADFAEGTEWTIGSAAASDIAIYCKWEDAHAMAGTYRGANVYSATSFSGGKSLTISPKGEVSGTKTGTIKDYDATTGNFKLYTSTSTYYYGYYDVATKGLAFNDKSGKDELGNDTYIFVNGTNAMTSVGKLRWDNNANRVEQVTVNGETIYLVIYNNKYYAYAGVSVIDSAGESVTAIGSFATKGNVMTITDKNGNTIVTLGHDGTTFIASDGLAGTYTCDGNAVVLDGYGSITIGESKVDYTVLESGNLYYVLNNQQHVISLGEGTYVVELDGMQGTWTLPDDAGTITLDGYGSAGDGKTYVVSGTTLTVYDGDSHVSYGIGENKVLLGKSVFAGLTFTSSSYTIVFEDGIDIVGKFATSSWPKYEYGVTGVLNGNVLTLTVTSENYNMEFIGKTMTATVENGKLVFTAAEFKYNNSDSVVGTEATCEGFSL